MKKVFTSLTCLFSALILCNAQHPSIGGYNVYYGHIHNHCGYSDGTGSPDQAYSYAKDKANLDFFSLSDHAEMLSDDEYASIINTANYYNQNGEFTTFYGFEWTSTVYGHLSIFNTLDYKGSGWYIFSTFNKIMSWVNERDCIVFFNHPGHYDGFNTEFDHFKDGPSDKFVGMELWNGNDAFDEFYYNDGYYNNDGNKGYFDEALIRRWRIGAGGSEDNHSDNWGNKNDYRLAILSNNLTREDLYVAMQERRFFSTLDKNLSMSFKINGSEMGAVIEPGSLYIQILLNDADNEVFNTVDLLKNGEIVKTWDIRITQPDLTFADNGVAGDYFYIRCKQEDGNEAISSPIFIRGIDESTRIPIAETDFKLKSEETIIENLLQEEILENPLAEDIKFLVYPNPANNERINIRVDDFNGGLQLLVTDINGKILFNQIINENLTTLSVLNPGVYFVRLTNNTITKTQILLVK